MLDKKYNEVIEDLKNNMESPIDSEYARKVITDLTMTYLEEMNKLEKSYEKRIKLCNLKLAELERRIESLEEEIFEDGEEDYISILCPYCNANIIVDSSNQEKEIECPECNNMIELDWEENEDDDIM